MSDKVDFKPKLVRRDKEDLSILITATLHQEEITIGNLYVSNNGAYYFKQTLLDLISTDKLQHRYRVRLRNPLSITDRSSRQMKSTKIHRIKGHCRQNGLTRLLHSISSGSNTALFFSQQTMEYFS
jgi:hypothetical protein